MENGPVVMCGRVPGVLSSIRECCAFERVVVGTVPTFVWRKISGDLSLIVLALSVVLSLNDCVDLVWYILSKYLEILIRCQR